MPAHMTNKALKRHRETASARETAKEPPALHDVPRITADELEGLRLHFHAENHVIRLGNSRAIRNEMKRVYRGVVKGKLPLGAGTKLVYILDRIAKSENDDEKLRILERGGIQGAPFVGLQILPPAKPSDTVSEGEGAAFGAGGQRRPEDGARAMKG